MEILVVGGTGTVGSAVVRRLSEEGVRVRVLTRSPEKTSDLPAGARAVRGDLREPTSLPDAFAGAEAAFLLTALAEDETEQGLAGVRAARTAGVRRAVYMSVAMPPGSEHIPHFASKIPIEDELRRSLPEWAIIRPNEFFQNDARLRDAIVEHGVYPLPIGSRGVNRVDARDIADLAVAALTRRELGGRVLPAHGPEALTGDDVAATYAHHLGQEVRYLGDDLDAWEAAVRSVMPGWLVGDLRIMYEHFQRHGFRATHEELAEEREVLGSELRGFDDFVAEVVPTWAVNAPDRLGPSVPRPSP